MATEKIYVKGFRTFPKRDGAPDFVLGQLVINLREFSDWVAGKDIQAHYTEYDGKKQLRCDILEGDKGIYFTVNTFKPEEKKEEKPSESKRPEPEDDGSGLPF